MEADELVRGEGEVVGEIVEIGAGVVDGDGVGDGFRGLGGDRGWGEQWEQEWEQGIGGGGATLEAQEEGSEAGDDLEEVGGWLIFEVPCEVPDEGIGLGEPFGPELEEQCGGAVRDKVEAGHAMRFRAEE